MVLPPGGGSGSTDAPGSHSGPGAGGPDGTASGGRSTDAGSAGPTAPTGSRSDGGPAGGIGGFVRSLADHIGSTVQPAAVVAVANTFGFPLALMLAVLLFLIVQSRLDGRDPKLRSAPLRTADTFLPFADEVRT